MNWWYRKRAPVGSGGALLRYGLGAAAFYLRWPWSGLAALLVATPLEGIARRLARLRMQDGVGRSWWIYLVQLFGGAALVVLAYGLAAAQGTPDEPARMPVAACDYTTGYLAALGTLVALGRRAREGGSYHVRASLCQTGMWFQRLGAACDPARASGVGDPADLTVESETAWGRLRRLTPAVELSETPPTWRRPPVPLGTHAPVWPDRQSA